MASFPMLTANMLDFGRIDFASLLSEAMNEFGPAYLFTRRGMRFPSRQTGRSAVESPREPLYDYCSPNYIISGFSHFPRKENIR